MMISLSRRRRANVAVLVAIIATMRIEAGTTLDAAAGAEIAASRAGTVAVHAQPPHDRRRRRAYRRPTAARLGTCAGV